jgi:hypothetical protein
MNDISIHLHATATKKKRVQLPPLGDDDKEILEKNDEEKYFDVKTLRGLDVSDNLMEDDEGDDEQISSAEQLVAESEDEISTDDDVKDDEASLLLDFCAMVQDTPPGALGDDEAGLIREAMVTIGSVGDADAAELVEGLLYRLLDEWETVLRSNDLNRIELVKPLASDFEIAISTWEKATSFGTRVPVVVEHMWTIYNDQQDLFRRGIVSVQPTRKSVQTVLRILADASRRERDAARKAWSVLEKVPDMKLSADADMYTSVIIALARSKQSGAAHRAESVLKEAVALFPPIRDSDGNAHGMTREAFNVILTAWAKSGEEDGPERAEKLLVYMDKVDKNNGSPGLVNPTVSSFTSLIDAYAQINDWDGVNKSEGVLNRLLDEYLENNDPELEPNVASWTIVISAWTRLSRKNYKGAANKAERLLKRMETLHEAGRVSFPPDVITYITCMNAFAASKTPDGPIRAEEILDEMNEKYIDGDDSFRPSPKTIRSVVDAWIKGDASNCMERAEGVVDRYKDYLDHQTAFDDVADIYRSMLFGWAKRSDPVRAQSYLVQMVEKGMKPDSFSFDKIIEANTQLDDEEAIQRTYKVFELMEECHKKGDVKPNERVYTSFIRALTKARVKDLPKRASLLLKRMQELFTTGNKGIKPTTFTYNAVLNACAETPSTEDGQPIEAFKVAVSVFNDLRSNREQPDHVTFGNMLRCAALLPNGEQREKVIQTTFEACCEKGFVNAFVLRDLQYAAPESLWRSLLQCSEGEADLLDIPSEWTRKFKNRK